MENEMIDIQNKNGELLVSSREVASNFERRKADVVKAIETHIENLDNIGNEEVRRQMFTKTEYVDRGKIYPEYLMNKDGFSLLVMSFNNTPKVLTWKLKYIEAFNLMEESLKQTMPMLTEEQRLQLAIFNTDSSSGIRQASAELDNYRKQQILEKEEVIMIQQPKADNYDKLIDSDGLLSWEQFVKNANLKLGRGKFMKFLRDKKVLLKEGRTPYQSYMDRGYFSVKQVPIPNGSYVEQTFITRKGLDWLMRKCGEWGLYKEVA